MDHSKLSADKVKPLEVGRPNPRDPRFDKLDRLIQASPDQPRPVRPPLQTAKQTISPQRNGHQTPSERRLEYLTETGRVHGELKKQRLEAHAQKMRARPAKQVINATKNQQRRISDLANQCASALEVLPSAVLDTSNHTRLVVYARAMLIQKLKKAPGVSAAQIARWLGLHHTSVLHALNKQLVWKRGPYDLAERDLATPLKNVALDGPVPYPDESGIWAI